MLYVDGLPVSGFRSVELYKQQTITSFSKLTTPRHHVSNKGKGHPRTGHEGPKGE